MGIEDLRRLRQGLLMTYKHQGMGIIQKLTSTGR
jgi:hypothetical protein